MKAEQALAPDTTVEQSLASVLEGNRRAAGRLISRIENDEPHVEAIMRALYPHTGHAYIVGLTGPPGAGKSTLADELIGCMRSSGSTVGVIAVDPNSPFSGGAILGDRIRMMRHASDRGVFIRSMGARGTLGGLARATVDAARVLDAMRFDIILIETVGVGQSELEIARQADSTVVVIPPGMGDSVQAIKAGIMEIADIFVVNKADHPQAAKTIGDIRDLLHMQSDVSAWTPPVVSAIALQGEGVADLWMRIRQHREYLSAGDELVRRRKRRLEKEIMDIVWRRIIGTVLHPRMESEDFQATLDLVLRRRLDPYAAASQVAPELPSTPQR